MSIRRVVLLVGAATVLTVVSAWGFGFVSKQLRIDRCLDDGGRWNYELSNCERARA